MKYWITENGLEPFDLTVTELLSLIEDITDGFKPSDNIPHTLYVLGKTIDSDNHLFKHPALTRKDMRKLLNTGDDNRIVLGDGVWKAHEQELKRDGLDYIISSVNVYGVFMAEVNSIYKSQFRKYTIDSLLKDLD